MQDLRGRDRIENIVDEDADLRQDFVEIVGTSAALKRILRQVEVVAPDRRNCADSGRNRYRQGAGRARDPQAESTQESPFITLNCAAIPTGLLESELFGYEKGAFTGALSQKIGRFEMAHRGTLFLDEIGDIPLDLQPKLLRALQEKSFERLGGTRTIPIDVRLVAATNRNLPQMMGDKLFRSDLYYRLKVFPITTPPLRDHPEDIPVLARHFVKKYAAKDGPADRQNSLGNDARSCELALAGKRSRTGELHGALGHSLQRRPACVLRWRRFGPMRFRLAAAQRSRKWSASTSSGCFAKATAWSLGPLPVLAFTGPH